MNATKVKPKSKSKVYRVTLRDLASMWIACTIKENDAKSTRREITEYLLPKMLKSGMTSVQVGRYAVQLIIDRDKQPTKGDLIKHFGKEAAERFWKTVPSRISQYLSLIEVVEGEKPGGPRRRGL